jgi:hypothetical protein
LDSWEFEQIHNERIKTGKIGWRVSCYRRTIPWFALLFIRPTMEKKMGTEDPKGRMGDLQVWRFLCN